MEQEQKLCFDEINKTLIKILDQITQLRSQELVDIRAGLTRLENLLHKQQ